MKRVNRSIHRRDFLKIAGGAALAAPFLGRLGRAESTKERPNFLVLLTDDQRWDCLSCMGHPVLKTPEIDRLAEGGVTFNNAFVTTSICGASRGSILSGHYARRTGVGLDQFYGKMPSRAVASSYPVMLQNAGYRVGCLGKFGVNEAGYKEHMDTWFAWAGQGRYFHEVDGEKVHNAELLTRKAEDFLRGGPADQPFCLMVNYKAPHGPFDPDPRDADLFAGVDFEPPETAGDEYFNRLHPIVQQSLNAKRGYSVRRYLQCIASVDRSVGRIVKALDELGLAENTCVLFLSDNGYLHGEHGLAGKWLMYEESIRVPLIIRYPKLPAAMRGARTDAMALNLDISPTIIELAGLDVPTDVDGRSLGPILRGEGPTWRDDFLYEHHCFRNGVGNNPGPMDRIAASDGVRTRDWKYIRYLDTDPLYEELFDLRNDPIEAHNLADDPAQAAQLDRMRARYEAYLTELERK